MKYYRLHKQYCTGYEFKFLEGTKIGRPISVTRAGLSERLMTVEGARALWNLLIGKGYTIKE
jgi:hypothetical protein